LTAARCSEQEFIATLERHGTKKTAKILDIDETSVRQRRRRLEKNLGIMITVPGLRNDRVPSEAEGRLHTKIWDGCAIIGSDAHFWPGVTNPAFEAMLILAKKLQPKIVIMNGDALDFPKISRHARIGWEDEPEVYAEIIAGQENLTRLEAAAPNAERYWPLGNHDARFETRLSNDAPDYANIYGFHLKDHFPYWRPCESVWFNEAVVVKHRYRGGVHAVWNNVVHAGKTIVTGHLHNLQVRPYNDYNGIRWGVDTGTLANPYGPQFEYMEDNPRNWRSGFIVLFFEQGELRWPQVCHIISDERAEFRGESFEI